MSLSGELCAFDIDSPELDLWARLTPELIRKVASYLHPNEVLSCLKTLNKETAQCICDDSFRTFLLGRARARPSDPHIAEQPWPGRDFVAHWGRPGPWRSLSLPHRRRLLCLAASSGHLPSLDAALAHAGCSLKPEMLTAAASVGSLAACERLLGAGCIPAFKAALAAAAAGGHLDVMRLLLEKMEAAQQEASAHGDPHLETYKQPAACKAAAKAGQLPALRFLLESTDGAPQSKAIGYAAAGACEGGQLAILHWLQQAHGYSPTLEDAIFAAAGGQAAVLEQLLPALLPADGSRPRPSGDAWEVLQEIAYACPVAVLQRHFGRLCRAAGGPEYLRGNESLLLEAVVGSPTPCWAAKLDFLLSSSALGPDVGARVLVQMRFELYGKASRHGLPRLQHLRALVERVGGVGDVPPADGQSEVKTALAAAQMAAAHGHADALAYLWDECGVPMQLQPHQLLQWPPVAAGPVGYAAARLAVVRLLQERGALFGPADVRQAAFTGLSEEIVLALIDMVLPAAAGGSSPDGGGGDAAAAAAATTAAESTLDRTRLESRDDWAAAFSHAARGGAGVRVLQALRERGAPLNLSAVVVGCSDEVLEWAVEQLEAEEGRVQVGEDLVAEFYRHGNFAALRWLYERGRLEGDAVRWLAGRVELGGIWGCRVTAA